VRSAARVAGKTPRWWLVIPSWKAVSLALYVLFVPAAATALEEITGPAWVLEGDLISIRGQSIRLWGIDAPEREQTCVRNGRVWRCGQAATVYLRKFVGSNTVTCRPVWQDSDDVVHARCRMKGLDLAADMATRGYALIPPNGPRAYVLNRNEGRTRGAGLWSGLYMAPWDWRAGKRLNEWISDNRGCSIKGDIEQDGARVFHLPSDRSFEAVRIQADKGERWFCSQEEALGAGWVWAGAA